MKNNLFSKEKLSEKRDIALHFCSLMASLREDI
jgi:hypothetical protein